MLFHPKGKAIGCIHIPQHMVVGLSWGLFGILRPLDSYDFLCILFSSKGLKHSESCDGAYQHNDFMLLNPACPACAADDRMQSLLEDYKRRTAQS